MRQGTLIFFCGKMGAGKTTKSREIAQQRGAVLLCEDEWLMALYPDQIATLEDYIRHAALLRPPMKRLAQTILAAGTDVVMDFPANTVRQRAWFKTLYAEIQAPHQLIVLDVPDAVCLERVAQRGIEQPERAVTDTAEMFEQVTQHFSVPTADEGFNITVVACDV